MTLKWDGSDLGKFNKDSIIESSKYEGYKYVLMNLNNQQIYGILTAAGKLACICDEIKPLFGLIKTGSHSLTIGSKSYVLYTCSLANGIPLYDDTISDFILKRYDYLNLKERIIKLFVFRHIMGVSPNTESGIRVRKSSTGFIYPISFNDKFKISSGQIEFGVCPMSEKTYKKWLNEENISQILREMLNVNSNEDCVQKLVSLRNSINTILTRIDKNLNWLENYMMPNLYHYIDQPADQS